ncbi:MAG: nucleotidyltransferase domain-containing protein [Elainellaceae cyanobacterium]
MIKLPDLVRDRIKVSPIQIADFCDRWNIVECALFGSVLRDDFHRDSDIDILVTFEPDRWFTWDDWMAIEKESTALFGRNVDLVSKEYLKNPYRRYEILNTCHIIYAIEKP